MPIPRVSRFRRLSIGRLGLALCLLGLVTGAGPVQAGQPLTRNRAPQRVNTQAAAPRRVNIPYFAGAVDDDAQSAIFWFGKDEASLPGQNYVDVRMAYTPDGLYWRALVVDYFLWYKADAQPGDVLTQTDAIALYLDTGHDRANSPQADDYYFLAGLHGDRTGSYRRQAKGTGAGWNVSWTPTPDWSDYSGWEWYCNPGPNSNTCGPDYGWAGGGLIPWQTLGLSSPPADGTVWGMGVLLYNQSSQPAPPANTVVLENWPETYSSNNPGTWGELHFGLAHYTPPPAIPRGTTLIRTEHVKEDRIVEDSWMGGGGSCGGGALQGGSTTNHGTDSALFVGSETRPTHFPCFNKSYLRFPLNSVPPGKVILSATLTLHQWGSAGNPNDPNPGNQGHDSYVWLSSISQPWNEVNPGGITWNNAPMAQQNYSVTKIPTWPANTPIVWPGKPFTWDATQVVAEAYAAGQPLSIALYDSGSGRNTSKYLTSSDVGLTNGTPDWDVEGRPRLDIVWGDRPPRKSVSNPAPRHDTPVTYSLTWTGAGQAMTLTDTLPNGLDTPFALHSSTGTAPAYNAGTRQITWSGTPALGQAVTLTYGVTPLAVGPIVLQNTAELASGGTVTTFSAAIIVDGYEVWLPAVTH